MHLRRTVLAVAVGVMAPASLLVTPSAAADSPPAGLALPDRPSEGGGEERDPESGEGAADDGVTVSVRGVPEEFTAGGPWQELTLVVDAEPSSAGREVTFMLVDGALELHAEHADVQVFGEGRWRDVAPSDPSDATAHYSLCVPAGTTELSVRVRFHDDAPTVDSFFIGAADAINLESPWYESRIVRPTDPGDPGDPGGEVPADPGGEDPTDPGDPGGEDPTDPGGEAGTGEPVEPVEGSGEMSGAGVRPQLPEVELVATEPVSPAADAEQSLDAPSSPLAETGVDSATRWQLGVGGAAVALGSALAVGAGRHRRRNAA
ncbi:hypothetical protein [Streptomyces noursei]|uniref:hypothetical protein n=1 Tax=Streptomyces noursei TaxID=1971 RepID=UPI0035DC3EBD